MRTRHWVRKEVKMEHEKQITTIMKSNRNTEKKNQQSLSHSLLTTFTVCASRKTIRLSPIGGWERKSARRSEFFLDQNWLKNQNAFVHKVFSSGLSSLWLTHTSEFHRWIFSGLISQEGPRSARRAGKMCSQDH